MATLVVCLGNRADSNSNSNSKERKGKEKNERRINKMRRKREEKVFQSLILLVTWQNTREKMVSIFKRFEFTTIIVNK